MSRRVLLGAERRVSNVEDGVREPDEIVGARAQHGHMVRVARRCQMQISGAVRSSDEMRAADDGRNAEQRRRVRPECRIDVHCVPFCQPTVGWSATAGSDPAHARIAGRGVLSGVRTAEIGAAGGTLSVPFSGAVGPADGPHFDLGGVSAFSADDETHVVPLAGGRLVRVRPVSAHGRTHTLRPLRSPNTPSP